MAAMATVRCGARRTAGLAAYDGVALAPLAIRAHGADDVVLLERGHRAALRARKCPAAALVPAGGDTGAMVAG
jgi:hypothetical protein